MRDRLQSRLDDLYSSAAAIGGEAQDYSMDDGQIKVRALRADLKTVNDEIARIESSLTTLEMQIAGCSTTHMRMM